MIQAIFLMLVLVTACGRHEHDKFRLPTDTATTEERAKINAALGLIQRELDESGVDKKVDSIKIVVADLEDPRVRGRCYQDDDGNGLGIVLTRDTLGQDSINENYHPWYLTVLLHEIGHCHFDREHEDEVLSPYTAELSFGESDENKSELGLTIAGLAPSVMNSSGSPMMLKSMFPYYVREIAGIERVQSWQQVGRLVNARVSEHP